MIITDQLHVIQKRRRRENFEKKLSFIRIPPCFAPLENKGGVLIKNSSDRCHDEDAEVRYTLHKQN